MMGKGGVGKSTLAEALALSQSEESEVLLIRIKSYSLTQKDSDFDQEENDFRNLSKNVFEEQLHLHRVAKQFFTVNLGKIPIPSGIKWVTNKINSGLSSDLASKLLNNRYILKFIEACPGLTPTLFIGKICREALEGSSPRGKRWTHVVVDAPSTGQALQLFESAKTLSHVLSHGPVHRFINDTLNFVFSTHFEVHLMTLPEDGPVEECFETLSRLKKINLEIKKLWVNRVIPETEKVLLENALDINPDSKNQLIRDIHNDLRCEIERIQEQRLQLDILSTRLNTQNIVQIPEYPADLENVPAFIDRIITLNSSVTTSPTAQGGVL